MKIEGTAKNDVLYGSATADKIKGNGGDDVLIGGAGADTLVGGKGADIFVVSGGDTILDFKPGVDKIIIDMPFERLAFIGQDTFTSYGDNPSLVHIVTTVGVTLHPDDILV